MSDKRQNLEKLLRSAYSKQQRLQQQGASIAPKPEERIFMRALVLSTVGVLMNFALNLTLTKYGMNFPDWLIIAFWIVPLVPLGWWLLTHPSLTRHRGWIESSFRQHRLATITAVVILLVCFIGVGHGIWAWVSRPIIAPSTTGQSQQNQPAPSPTKQQGGVVGIVTDEHSVLDNVKINSFGQTSIENHGSIDMKDSEISGGKVGLDNRNPSAKIKIDKSKIQGGETGMINRAPKEDSTKPPQR